MNNFDARQVYQFWDVFKGGNQLTEIRLIASDGKTASGYFTDPKIMIEAVKPYINDYSVYFTINSINPDCYGRPQRDRIMQRVKNTTTDGEIISREWVFLDLDSKRASGVNATEEQLSNAKQKANEVYKFLRFNGFNEPIVICSGSGVHLYLRCALLPSEENTALVKRFTQALSMLFSDEQVEVDEKVFNLGRIARVCGYYNRKGTNADKDRPQRLCEFVRVPSEIKVNAREYFEKIAAMYPDEVKPTRENNYSTEKFDLESFLDKHDIKVTKIEQVAGGKKYVLDHCVFNESHRGKDAVIFQRDSGQIAYHCFHSSCQQYTWRDVRIKFEPNAYDKKDYNEFQFKQRYYGNIPKPFEPVKEDSEKGKKWLTIKDIKRQDESELIAIPTGFLQLDKAIKGLLLGECTVLSGINASGKSSWLDIVMLNAIQRGFKVACWSGELQDKNLKRWLMQAAAGKSYLIKNTQYENSYDIDNKVYGRIEDWLQGKFFLYNNNYGSRFEQLLSDLNDIIDQEKTQLIIVDNCMAVDLDGKAGDKNDKQKQFILSLVNLAKVKNVHIIVVCHPRKEANNSLLRKESISGSGDLTNAVQNCFIIHRVGEDFIKRATDFFGAKKVEMYKDFNNVIEVCKSRSTGVMDFLVGLYYEPESRRFKNYVAENIMYGWYETPIQQTISTPNNMVFSSPVITYENNDMPFEPGDDEKCPF